MAERLHRDRRRQTSISPEAKAHDGAPPVLSELPVAGPTVRAGLRRANDRVEYDDKTAWVMEPVYLCN